MEWQAARDERVRPHDGFKPFIAPMEFREVSVKKRGIIGFVMRLMGVGGWEKKVIPQIPFNINCRCVVAPRIVTPQRMTNAQAVDYVSNNDLW